MSETTTDDGTESTEPQPCPDCGVVHPGGPDASRSDESIKGFILDFGITQLVRSNIAEYEEDGERLANGIAYVRWGGIIRIGGLPVGMNVQAVPMDDIADDDLPVIREAGRKALARVFHLLCFGRQADEDDIRHTGIGVGDDAEEVARSVTRSLMRSMFSGREDDGRPVPGNYL